MAPQMRWHLQAVSKALALQMQQLQQQVTDSITAAAAVRHEKQAATEQLHQVCFSLDTCTNWLSFGWLKDLNPTCKACVGKNFTKLNNGLTSHSSTVIHAGSLNTKTCTACLVGSWPCFNHVASLVQQASTTVLTMNPCCRPCSVSQCHHHDIRSASRAAATLSTFSFSDLEERCWNQGRVFGGAVI